MLAPDVIANTFTVLPVPCGRTTVPLTCWSACLGSTPSLNATSTVSLNLAVLVFKTNSKASFTSLKLSSFY